MTSPVPLDVSVVLPCTGGAAALLAALDVLLDRWPAELEAELLVPATGLTAGDRALLAGLDASVPVLVQPDGASLGELAVAAAHAAAASRLLVLDATDLPGTAELRALVAQAPAAEEVRTTPVLTAARDLRALRALTGGRVVPAADAAPASSSPASTDEVDVVVLGPDPAAVRRTAEAAARATRLRTRTRPATPATLPAVLEQCTGSAVAVLAAGVSVPRFWLEELHAAVQNGAAAAGPRWGAREDADAWRRSRTGRQLPTGDLAGDLLLVRREALPLLLDPDGGLDGAAGRLVAGGHALAVADAVLATRTARHGRPLLSAALIVKDEQAALPACLASLRGVVDEVVVCDTGSTDRTVEIALALGARVVHTGWQDDFAAARNTALAECAGTWVLSIDADEQLRLEPGTDLRALLRGSREQAHTVRIVSRSDDSGASSYAHEAGRLFRADGLRWAGAVHENLQVVRTGQPPRWTPCPGASLIHDGYLDATYSGRDKAARNLALAEKDHAAAAGTPRAWKAAYELARALSKHVDLAPGAVTVVDPRLEPLLREALAGIPAAVRHLRCDAQVRLSRVLVALDRHDEAVETARDALATDAQDVAAALNLARLLAGTGAVAEAVQVLATRQPPAERSPVYDAAREQVELPLLNALLLREAGRPDESAAVLAGLAERVPASADWAGLHALARGPLRARMLQAAALAPQHALAGWDGLDPQERDALHAALTAHGVDVQAWLPATLQARRLAEALAGTSPAALAAAATALEDEDPAGALALWRQVPGAPAAAQVGAARCLLALDRLDDALDALEGLDPDDLVPGDVLVVVALVLAAGDTGTAEALLVRLPADLPGELSAQRAALARTAGLHASV